MFFKINVTTAAGEHASTCVVAFNLADARTKGLKQLGIQDPPPAGITTAHHRIDVGECSRQEFIDCEAKRLGIRREDVQMPD